MIISTYAATHQLAAAADPVAAAAVLR